MTTNNIKVYLIGGAVRDQVLNRPHKDLDFVVVGATPSYMESLGFVQVGADFPVYLHPVTSDEFALARVERKTGAGYHGFEVDFDTTVTLEDDLIRRDLTMNSMAFEVHGSILKSGDAILVGKLIDPYNGRLDAVNGVLRHTSEAFAEDPLRVLRTCRFAARYNFDIAAETVDLMCTIVTSGEMQALPKERVFAEFKKVMMEDRPDVFFDYMSVVGAHDLYFGGVVDWWNKGLQFGILMGAAFEERVALMLNGMPLNSAKAMLTNLMAPNSVIDTVVWMCHLYDIINEIHFRTIYGGITTEVLWEAINSCSGWKNLEKLQKVAHLHLYWGSAGVHAHINIIMKAVVAGAKVSFADLDPDTRGSLVGKEIGEAISKRRLEILDELNLFPHK